MLLSPAASPEATSGPNPFSLPLEHAARSLRTGRRARHDGRAGQGGRGWARACGCAPRERNLLTWACRNLPRRPQSGGRPRCATELSDGGPSRLTMQPKARTARCSSVLRKREPCYHGKGGDTTRREACTPKRSCPDLYAFATIKGMRPDLNEAKTLAAIKNYSEACIGFPARYSAERRDGDDSTGSASSEGPAKSGTRMGTGSPRNR
jgi:hypothetical protein